jgi:hypothetical protein
MRYLIRFSALAVALLICAVVYAAQVQTTLDITRKPVILTAVGKDAAVLATDTGSNANKRAQVVTIDLSDAAETTAVLLVRVQDAPNGLFIDIVGEATIGELSTRVSAMTLTGNSHPSTAEDAIDTAVIAAAGG